MARWDDIVNPARMTIAYNRVVSFVFVVILLFTILTMLVGVGRLFYVLAQLLSTEGITGNYINIFSDVLTLFILIELSRSLFDYINTHRLYLPILIDVGIVFIIRHVMIAMFNHEMDSLEIAAVSLLLLALGAVRFSATKVIREEDKTGAGSEAEAQ